MKTDCSLSLSACFFPRWPSALAVSLLSLGSLLACLSAASLSAQTLTFAGAGTPVSFGNVNLCAAGKTTPAPCNKILTLTYHVTEGGTLGAIKVVTWGSPNLDFTQASGSTCSGTVTAGESCTVNVKFAPLYAGSRPGAVLLFDESGKVLATTRIAGNGIGPQIAFNPATQTVHPLQGFSPRSLAVDGAGDIFFIGEDSAQNSILGVYPAGGGAPIQLGSAETYFTQVALDGAGDLFVIKYLTGRYAVIEFPAGGGPQITLPISATTFIASSFAVDGAGDIYALNFGSDETDPVMIELPAGGGPQRTLAFPIPTESDYLLGPVAVDGVGDVFALGFFEGNIFELPGGVAPQRVLETGLPFDYTASDLAADAIGDAFIFSPASGVLAEVPVGGGAATAVTFFDVNFPAGLTVDSAGDLFLVTRGIAEIQRSQAAPLNFGVRPAANTTILPLTVQNVGTAPLTIEPLSSNVSYRVMSTQPEACLSGTPAGASCTLEIGFTPPGTGATNGVLALQTNAVNNPMIALEGMGGVPSPVISLASGFYATAQTVTISDELDGAEVYYTTDGSLPTTSSIHYTGPITVAASERITAIAADSGVSSDFTSAAYAIASGQAPANVVDFGKGFTGARSSLQLNGNTGLDGTRLQLTNGGLSEAGSAFTDAPVNIQQFTTYFTFQQADAIADGLTFTIQNSGATALGGIGGYLGYKGIGRSVAIKFDLFSNEGEGTDSTGIYKDGAPPSVPAIDLTGSGINLRSGDAIAVRITYNGTTLLMNLTDTVTGATSVQSFPINIPAVVGGNTAYVGFTAATGGLTANQEILSWTYVAGTPAAPPPLPALPPYATGFTAEGLFTNGFATLSGTTLQLVDYGTLSGEGSAWYANPVNIQAFTSDFTLALTDAVGYGLTFTIQNVGPKALGSTHQGLGYEGIGKSVAVKFEFDSPNSEAYEHDSTGIYVDGVSPSTPALDMTSSGVDPRNGDPIHVHLVYDGSTLTLTAADPYVPATYTHSFPIDIPAAVGGNTAYVGFTGAHGSYVELGIQQILNWTFTNP